MSLCPYFYPKIPWKGIRIFCFSAKVSCVSAGETIVCSNDIWAWSLWWLCSFSSGRLIASRPDDHCTHKVHDEIWAGCPSGYGTLWIVNNEEPACMETSHTLLVMAFVSRMGEDTLSAWCRLRQICTNHLGEIGSTSTHCSMTAHHGPHKVLVLVTTAIEDKSLSFGFIFWRQRTKFCERLWLWKSEIWPLLSSFCHKWRDVSQTPTPCVLLSKMPTLSPNGDKGNPLLTLSVSATDLWNSPEYCQKTGRKVDAKPEQEK